MLVALRLIVLELPQAPKDRRELFLMRNRQAWQFPLDRDSHGLDRGLHFGCHVRRERFHLMALLRMHGP